MTVLQRTDLTTSQKIQCAGPYTGTVPGTTRCTTPTGSGKPASWQTFV